MRLKLLLLGLCGLVPFAWPTEPAGSIHGDRWLEVDLYWFDRNRLQDSAERFWHRFAPLFAHLDGWKGVILNVGWTSSYLLDWRGDLDGRIPLPEGMQEENRYNLAGMLTGTTAERRAQWKERFSHPAARANHNYPPWTYREVKTLAEMMRKTAASHGLPEMRIGSLVIGWRTAYGGQDFAFETRHPNIVVRHVSYWDAFDPRARLSEDPIHYGAFPGGIKDGLPLTEFFGRQWGSLSSALGLDAILLRDSMIGPIPYRRGGPYGEKASPDPADTENWTRCTADLVRLTKQANPRALVIGYSTGASAVGEWRVGSVDLETIARQGYLDAWIDQSWAGAWNEVGVREYNFWNSPTLGWNFQLGYILVHAAQLAGSRTRHYILSDPFDAWESWDSLHTAPQRFRWGIWAYLHAAVKTPSGLKMPEGSYISWANQGPNLLSAEDVRVLAAETNDALDDARKTTEVLGPTLVYNRPALDWRQHHDPAGFMSEWLDEQAATLLTFGVPILSIERIEDFARIPSDLPIVQTPAQLDPDTRQSLALRVAAGKPLAFFGSLSAGTDPGIRELAGITVGQAIPGEGLKARARLGSNLGALGAGVPISFELYQPALDNRAGPGTKVLYSVNGSAALTLRAPGTGAVLFWDPADLHSPAFPKSWDVSLRERMGSVYPFLLTARALTGMLASTGSPHLRQISPNAPATLLAWRTSDGNLQVLAADLSEGLTDGPRRPYEIKIDLPRAWSDSKISASTRWGKTSFTFKSPLEVPLSLATSQLYRLEIHPPH